MLYFCNSICRSCFHVVIALVSIGTSGCARPMGSVSGTVTYNGKSLPYGRVTFVCADGTVVSGKIESDGTYTIPQAPAGPAKVAVRCLEEAMPALILVDPSEVPGAKGAGSSANAPRTPMMMQSAERPKSKPKALRIPDHYQEAEKSGLSYEVQKGGQTYDIRLE
jgi:hypothetical protein